ncbi:MAG TPA: FAD-binding oxidoreductase [Candidatus Limnocylindrales bacterium]|jgi:ferredoxin/flavodoxin---NADP+ reductase|nr:FAD-binding oxidoreductase [Candidatus Limnocylindrales bacterium]
MTDLAIDDRPIAAESERYNAYVSRRVDLTESLAFFWVRYDDQPVDFEPGQYLTIGLESDGKLIQRPYSVASSPRETEDGYEYYIRLVNGGMFTPLLWRVGVGQRMSQKGPKGKFVLEPQDDRQHVFISSGTGIAPFISMMKTLLHDGVPRPAIVLHGASYEHDLGYRELLEEWQDDGTYPLTYVPTVSRPGSPENSRWTGRTGRVETIIPAVYDELGLTPDNSIAYICGNPDMITAVDQTLAERGFPEAQIKKELYWPKGKEPRAAGLAVGTGTRAASAG